MIDFATTFGAIIASFFFPCVIAIVLCGVAIRFMSGRYVAAFAIGIYLWFFPDTLGGANYLSVSEGFGGGIWQVILWILFALGVIIVLSIDRDMFVQGPLGDKFAFGIPILVALAIGIHGTAEGAAIGATAATTSSTNLVDAFGGATAGIAFIFHKGLEPVMVGAAYWIYAKDHAKNTMERVRDIIVLSLAFSLPGIIGGGSIYFIIQSYPGADLTYAYALGVGTSVYALLRMARPVFLSPGPSKFDSLKVAVALILGFTALYLAALLHS